MATDSGRASSMRLTAEDSLDSLPIEPLNLTHKFEAVAGADTPDKRRSSWSSPAPRQRCNLAAGRQRSGGALWRQIEERNGPSPGRIPDVVVVDADDDAGEIGRNRGRPRKKSSTPDKRPGGSRAANVSTRASTLRRPAAATGSAPLTKSSAAVAKPLRRPAAASQGSSAAKRLR